MDGHSPLFHLRYTLQYIGGSGLRNVRHVTLIIRSLQALIILRQYDFRTGQFLRRIRTEVHHHLFDFVSSRLAQASRH